MPNSLSRETLRTILSDLPTIRTERQRRRVPSGTDEELLAFVADTFGYRIPDVACCPEHQTPARAFCDAYFGRDAVVIWKASRGFGGKSTLLALLALTEAVTLRADVTVLGGSGQQSERVLETLAQIWRGRSGIQYLFASGPGVRRTTLTFGNTITALPASQTAVRGPHPQRLRIDEADEMSLPLLDAAQGQPMDRSGVQAQTVISSTHQYPDGTMTTLLQRAASQGWPLYTWCWQETLEPNGWLSPAQVQRKRSEITAQMWRTEFDLQEPTAEGRAIVPEAVEQMFDAGLGAILSPAALEHVWRGESGPSPEAPSPVNGGPWYCIGIDWAQKQNYTVAIVLRCDTTPLRIVAVYRTHRRSWLDMTEQVGALLDEYPGPIAHDSTGIGSAIREYPALAGYYQLEDVTMVGRARIDLFRNYIGAVERHEFVCPRIDVLYTEHKYCGEDDLFGSGHPPDTVVALAMAYHAFKTGRRPGDYGITI